ncbi:beta-lactamase/transpeptidase-like protein [Lentinus tigrinus ALCF2SS1-6]|uniref:Beta-lactamase/transpeptidase-like protein n=1 Tax=Lentinus tigrinus ALCF2SS1-6 TaxID=1328759 RepID=A0A5C2S4M6_9APHY|nr:beta-lactamase/transpeptidase-like protein [Lentinus tigrinus ALCF2SS1-6]
MPASLDFSYPPYVFFVPILLPEMQTLALSFACLFPLLSTASATYNSIITRTTSDSAGNLITPEISTYAQSFVDTNLTPGLTLAVVRLDNTSYTSDFGSWGNRTEDGDLAQRDTLFALASVSKPFLVSALGILMDDFANRRNVTALPPGLFEFTFDTKMQALLPDVWKLEDDFASQKANIADLLSHVSGLTRNEFMYTRNSDTPLSVGKRLRYLHPGYELREQWSYCNLMYLVLPEVINRYSGKTFQEFVAERIFVPLNMTSTTYNLTAAEASGQLSQSFIFSGRRIPMIFDGPVTANLVAGAGGIISNAIDMAKWAATLLNGGVDPVTKKTIIPSWVFNETTTSRVILTGNTTDDATMSIMGYGLGWQRQSYLGHDIITHDGGIPGFVSLLIFLPRENLAVISLLNTDGPWPAFVPFAVVDSVLALDTNFTVPSLPSDSDSSGSASPNTSCAPSVPIKNFAGLYTNPGYGNLTFCAPDDNSTTYCAVALSDWASISPNGTVDPNALYATTLRVVTHAMIRHVCPDTGADSQSGETSVKFLLRLQSIYPHGFGRDTTPFFEAALSAFPEADVECLVDGEGKVSGCGWLNFEDGHKRTVGTVQERADIWWDKV